MKKEIDAEEKKYRKKRIKKQLEEKENHGWGLSRSKFDEEISEDGTALEGGGGRYHNLRNGKEACEDTEESPAGCAGEGNQNKRN